MHYVYTDNAFVVRVKTAHLTLFVPNTKLSKQTHRFDLLLVSLRRWTQTYCLYYTRDDIMVMVEWSPPMLATLGPSILRHVLTKMLHFLFAWFRVLWAHGRYR